jgi:hypothetical protein
MPINVQLTHPVFRKYLELTQDVIMFGRSIVLLAGMAVKRGRRFFLGGGRHSRFGRNNGRSGHRQHFARGHTARSSARPVATVPCRKCVCASAQHCTSLIQESGRALRQNGSLREGRVSFSDV